MVCLHTSPIKLIDFYTLDSYAWVNIGTFRKMSIYNILSQV